MPKMMLPVSIRLPSHALSSDLCYSVGTADLFHLDDPARLAAPP